MNNRNRTMQLTALAAFVAAVFVTGLAIPSPQARSNAPRTTRAPLTLLADGGSPVPVLPGRPPKSFV
jgi:hypothetical protein